MAGRVMLAKSVIESIPMYTMQVAHILVSTLEEIGKLQRAFVWGHDTFDQRMDTISWNNFVCQKKLKV